MQPAVRPTSPVLRCAIAGALLCLGLTGCGETDPLEPIRQQQALGDLQGSIEPLRELLAERPDDAEANFLYGRALALTQQQSLATWSLRKAMEDPEWLVPAGLQIAMAALATEDFNEAIELAGQVLEHEPDNTSALLLRAQAYAHWRKREDVALADAKRVLELDPNIIEAYEPLILSLIALGRQDEANEVLEEVGARLTSDEAPLHLLAWHCATTAIFANDSGDTERAREKWAECLDTYPSNGEVVWKAVEFYDAQGEESRSLEILQAALAAAPASRDIRVALADRLRRAGDPAAAEATLREATDSENPALAAGAWVDLAKLRHSMVEFSAAADAMEQAYELAEQEGLSSAQLVFETADALVIAGRLDRAQEVADEISVPAQRHLILGRIAQERREAARALEEFDEALRLWPDNPLARYYAALAAEEVGDFERALTEYRNSFRISATATDARTRAAKLLAAEGRPNVAFKVLHLIKGPLRREGELLSVELQAMLGELAGVGRSLSRLEETNPALVGPALARAAEGVNQRAGPVAAVRILRKAPDVDLSDPRYAPALRALVRFAHEAEDPAAAGPDLRSALAAHPNSGELHEIRGLDLELSGAPAGDVRAAYERALELEPRNARALAGMARLALPDDPGEALRLFDRAAGADPSNPDPQLQAAKILVDRGNSDVARWRLDALLVKHPFEAEAAALRVRLDLEQGVSTPWTLERALRAVRFGGGVEALELLSQVYSQRDEPELAALAAERAQALREAPASEG